MSWKMSGKVKGVLSGMNGEEISATEKLILLILSDYYSEEEGHAHPSLPRLAKEALCTDRTVRSSLRRLEEIGLLHTEFIEGASSFYYVLPNGCPTSTPEDFSAPPGKNFRPTPEKNVVLDRKSSVDTPEIQRQNQDCILIEPKEEPKEEPEAVQPAFNYKTFSSSYRNLAGRTSGKQKIKVELYAVLCRKYGEDAVLDALKTFVEERDGKARLKGNKYAALDFLKEECEEIIEMKQEEKKEKGKPSKGFSSPVAKMRAEAELPTEEDQKALENLKRILGVG